MMIHRAGRNVVFRLSEKLHSHLLVLDWAPRRVRPRGFVPGGASLELAMPEASAATSGRTVGGVPRISFGCFSTPPYIESPGSILTNAGSWWSGECSPREHARSRFRPGPPALPCHDHPMSAHAPPPTAVPNPTPARDALTRRRSSFPLRWQPAG